MLSKAVCLAGIFILATYQVEASGNACSSRDSSGLPLPDVMATYLGNPTLLNAYLTWFKSHEYVETLIKYLRQDVVNKDPMASLLALESALLTSNFLGNRVDDTCSLATAIDMAVDYENYKDIPTLICAIDFLQYSAENAINNVMEFFLQELGCGSYFDKPEKPMPTCSSRKCLSNGHPANWEQAYRVIVNYSKANGIPVNPSVFSDLKKLFATRDRNLWGVALTWLSVEFHSSLIFKTGINTDPKVMGLAVSVLQFMELIAFSKECSCDDRVTLAQKAVDGLVNAINSEFVLLKSKLK